MTKSPDYYAVLGVSAASDEVVIRAAFKALMLKYHPDTNRSPDATARAAAINEAFSVLGDPERRAAYDASRRERSAPPASPPPPPDKPASGAAANSEVPKVAAKAGWGSRIVGMIAVVLVGGVVRVAIQSINSGYHSPALASTAAAGEPEMTDTLSDNIDVAADRMDAMADATQPAGFGGNTQALSSPPSGTETFTLQPPTSIDFNVIEGAGNTFAKVLSRGGIAGARAWSQECHSKLAKAPSWPGADRCAAFDYAARYMDLSFVQAAGTRADPYFAFEAENQGDNYKAVGGQYYIAGERLQHIRSAVEPVTYEAVMAGIRQRENSNAPDPGIDTTTNDAATN
ncbi:J domain-containing protein [Sphingomonas sp. BAUL-RG-20F-R05-02]|uniref:J domain-containing protein n=1 Tax=Sphingomonas sp. BAUL-RG-20F-R05-02 TaxID=2914830 RepID=UPI001F59A7E4|nr:J domain-containing protein [Sphingomonas sp. BAUL-RG-20F-R05-02]